MYLITLSLLLVALSANAFIKPVNVNSRKGTISMNLNEQKSINWKSLLGSSIPKSISAILCTAALLSNPTESFAAKSGGRSGGSSFRSAPSTTRLNSYSGSNGYAPRSTYVSPPIIFSPFSYGFGYGFSPFSFMPINPSLLFFGIGAYALFTILSNRIGGSDFSNNGEGGSLGSGASIMKLQVSLDSDWTKQGNIMNSLSELSARSRSMSGRNELSVLLSDASLLLLRKNENWNSASFAGEMINDGKAEPYFQKLAIAERAKFESETVSGSSSSTSSRILDGRPTQAVVSIVVAIRGRSDALKKRIDSVVDVKQILQTLASEALTDNGENIMAVEVLWTPSEPGEVLTERNIIEDYPELLRL